MSGSYLFLAWISLLGLALFFVHKTNQLDNNRKNPIGRVTSIHGQVFERSETISVYESLSLNDRLFSGDYISTGIGASVEMTLSSDRKIVLEENSLIHLSLEDEDGIAADIVTVLKGDMIAKSTGHSTSPKSKPLKMRVGSSTIDNLSLDGGIRISKPLVAEKAVVSVLSGKAKVFEQGQLEKELDSSQVLKVDATPVNRERIKIKPLTQVASLNVPMIQTSPQHVIDNKALMAGLNKTLKSIDLSTLKPIEDKLEAQISAQEAGSLRYLTTNSLDIPPSRARTITAPQNKRVAIYSKPKSTPKKPKFQVAMITNSEDQHGPGIYLVKNNKIFAQIKGAPNEDDLKKVSNTYQADFIFNGQAEALLDSGSLNKLERQGTIYAVSNDGIEKIDIQLIQSRPAALDLLRRSHILLFKEPVKILVKKP